MTPGVSAQRDWAHLDTAPRVNWYFLRSPAFTRQHAVKDRSRLTRIFRSWLESNERRQQRSAGFQPAVSPTSSRQTVGKTQVVWNGRALRVGNPRYSRLAAVAPERRYGAPRRRKVCATTHAGPDYEFFGLKAELRMGAVSRCVPRLSFRSPARSERARFVP